MEFSLLSAPAVAPPTGLAGISCGGNHCYGLKGGAIWSVGHNANGQLGLGDTDTRTAFTEVTIDD
ncbi:hypothetical protein [Neptuniibacter sp. QD37_11]|uniref:hypothetical protein n=1 Tax=Neptuniibacter sp. QD37_11 TaxID=3398209 RepID=UPI0039F45426